MTTRKKLANGEFNLTPEQRSRQCSPGDRRKAIEANTSRLRKSLEEEYGLIDHPKAETLWGLAWEHGHACGYGEIINHYEDFAALLI